MQLFHENFGYLMAWGFILVLFSGVKLIHLKKLPVVILVIVATYGLLNLLNELMVLPVIAILLSVVYWFYLQQKPATLEYKNISSSLFDKIRVIAGLFLTMLWIAWGLFHILDKQPEEIHLLEKYHIQIDDEQSVLLGNSEYADLALDEKDTASGHVYISQSKDTLYVRNVSTQKRVLINDEDINTSPWKQGESLTVAEHKLFLNSLWPRLLGWQRVEILIDDNKLQTFNFFSPLHDKISINLSRFNGLDNKNIVLSGDENLRLAKLSLFKNNSIARDWERILLLAGFMFAGIIFIYQWLQQSKINQNMTQTAKQVLKNSIANVLLVFTVLAIGSYAIGAVNGNMLWVSDSGANRNSYPVSVNDKPLSDKRAELHQGDTLLLGYTKYGVEWEQKTKVLTLIPQNRIPKIKKAQTDLTIKNNEEMRDVSLTKTSALYQSYLTKSVVFLVVSFVIGVIIVQLKNLGVRIAALYGVALLLVGFGLQMQFSLTLKTPQFEQLANLSIKAAYVFQMMLLLFLLLSGWLNFRVNQSTASMGTGLYSWMTSTFSTKVSSRIYKIDVLWAFAAILLSLQVLAGGELGLSFPVIGDVQPLEPTKILILLYLASWTTYDVSDNIRGWWDIVWAGIPLLLLAVVKDFSPFLLMGIIFWTAWAIRFQGEKNQFQFILRVILLPLLIVAGLAFLYFVGVEQVQYRVNTWLDPWTHTQWFEQILRGYWLIQQGGIWGVGLGEVIATDLPPRVDDDLAFSLVLSELGMLGGALYMLSVILLAFRLFNLTELMPRVASYKMSEEGVWWRIFIFFFALLVLSQLFLVMASVTGLMPLMGQPLPFVSRGGSNLVLFFGLGIGLSIFGYARLHNWRQSAYKEKKAP